MARSKKNYANNTATSQGAARNATSLYGKDKAYTRGAKAALKEGKNGMAAHKAGMREAGLS